MGDRVGALERRVDALEAEVARLRSLATAAAGDGNSEDEQRARPDVQERIVLASAHRERLAEPPSGSEPIEVGSQSRAEIPVVESIAGDALKVSAPADAAAQSAAATEALHTQPAIAAASAPSSTPDIDPSSRRAIMSRLARRDFGSEREGFSSLEQAIGGRWYALIGAVIVLIGLGLFLKLAVDQGWLSFSPAARCVCVAIVGLGLLGTGEWAVRRASRAASAGFSAAGVGALISAVWAAERLYGLLGDGPAFALLASACAVGVAVSARLGLASVAVVSLIGAYLNPIIVGARSDDARGFMAYLLVLLATGLILPWWKGPTFALVRSLAWWGTMLAGTVVCGAELVQQRPEGVIVFAVTVWGMVHTELMTTAGRLGFGTRPADVPPMPGEDTGNREIPLGAMLNAPLNVATARSAYFNVRPLMSSFSSTAWATVFVSLALARIPSMWVWLAPAGFLAATLACAHVLCGHLRFLTDIPTSDRERLGVSLAVQSGSLLIAAVALAISGSAQSLAWVGMGVGAVMAGRWIRARGLDVYGLIVLVIALGRVLLYERFVAIGAGSWIAVLGLDLGLWNLIAAACSAGVLAAGWLTRRDASRRWLTVSSITSGVGMFVLLLALIGTSSIGPVSVVTGSVVAVLTSILASLYSSGGLRVLGILLNIMAIGVLAPIGMVIGKSTTPSMPLPGMAFGAWWLAISTSALSLAAQAWLLRHVEGPWRSAANVLISATVGLLFCAPIVQASAGPSWGVLAAMGSISLLWFSRSRESNWLWSMGVSGLMLGLCLAPMTGGWTDEADGRTLGGIVMSCWIAANILIATAWGLGRAWESRSTASGNTAATAERVHRTREVMLSIGMVLSLMAAPVHTQAWAASLCTWWIVLGLAALIASIRTRWTEVFMPGLASLGCATCAWFFSYGQVWQGWDRDAGPIFLSGGLWTALILVGAMAGAAWILLHSGERVDAHVRKHSTMLCNLLVTLAITMLWLSTSMEAGRIGEILSQERTFQRAAVSVWWGLFGLGLITGGFLWRGKDGMGLEHVRRAGLAMVGVAVLKALAWDLTQVPAIARVISFIGLGMLMMAVTVVYAKLAGRLLKVEVKGPALQTEPAAAHHAATDTSPGLQEHSR